MSDKEKLLKETMIALGKKLYARRLVAASAGNLSSRLDERNILITVTGAHLGELEEADIVPAEITSDDQAKDKRLSTEFPLHRRIYQDLPANCVIHCHPPLINGYFSVYSQLKALTFETRLYLGEVPVIAQETPSITDITPVIHALKTNNLAVIKNHGVVCAAADFPKGLDLIETLEEAVRVAGVARLFDKEILDNLDQALKKDLSTPEKAYPMFSREHIQAIVDLVNQDEFIAKKGEELGLTLKLAIKLDADNQTYNFSFRQGKIEKLEFDDNAPFVISAPAGIWELIFLGKLDPFVATTQGKMKLKGELSRLSYFYVAFSRLFELFRQVRIK